MKRSLMLVVVVTLAACGGGSSGGNGGNGAPTCNPSGTHLSITAANITFDKDCLAAPANQPFTIAFDNKDANTPHSVDILTSMNGRTLFRGQITTGIKTITYHVGALKPGTYHFHCEVHPDTMEGTFVVK